MTQHVMKALMLAGVLLAANMVPAQAEDRKECVRKYEQFRGWLHDDKAIDTTVIKRLCDPKNFVSNPNEYGWVCDYERGLMRVKGEGAKQRRDALCVVE